MKQKVTIIVSLIGLLFTPLTISAQTMTIKVPSNELIENSIKGALFLSRSEYQLREISSGDIYGLDENDYFGRYYTIGVSTTQGVYLDGNIINPWEKDRNYTPYKGKGRFEPILSEELNFFPLEKNNSSIQVAKTHLTEDSIFVVAHPKIKKIPVVRTAAPVSENVSGWVIWCHVDETAILMDSVQVDLSAVGTTIMPSAQGTKINTPRSGGRKMIGGLFVIASYGQNPGEIVLQIAGMLQQSNDGIWYLYNLPSVEQKSTKPQISQRVPSQEIQEVPTPTKIIKPTAKKKTKKQ